MNKSAISIETKNLTIGYRLSKRKKKVLRSGIDMQIFAGEVTCLLGPNGIGKSTLLRTLCRFQSPLDGTISVMGKDLYGYSDSELSLTMGVVLTEKTNAGGITVYELVSLGRHPHTGFFGQMKDSDHEAVLKSLKDVGMEQKAKASISELSDGEKQKVMIAKVLAQECPIIILDEPTAFLDVTSRIETMILLRKLAVEQNKTILLSTHDLDSALTIGDRLCLLSKEQPIAIGTPEELIDNGALGKCFDTENIRFDASTRRFISSFSK